MYRHRARVFEPDLVLLMFNDSNDLRNNHPLLERNNFLPYFDFENGDLVLDDSFRTNPNFVRKLRYSNPRNGIVNQFRLLQFVNLSLVSWIQGRGQRDPDSDASAKPQQFPWLNPSDEVWSESWRLTESQIAMLAMAVERDGAMFVLSRDTMLFSRPGWKPNNSGPIAVYSRWRRLQIRGSFWRFRRENSRNRAKLFVLRLPGKGTPVTGTPSDIASRAHALQTPFVGSCFRPPTDDESL